jgi:hypothetical protein
MHYWLEVELNFVQVAKSGECFLYKSETMPPNETWGRGGGV